MDSNVDPDLFCDGNLDPYAYSRIYLWWINLYTYRVYKCHPTKCL